MHKEILWSIKKMRVFKKRQGENRKKMIHRTRNETQKANLKMLLYTSKRNQV